MKLSDIAKCLGLDCHQDDTVEGVIIDSRQAKPHDLFVAFQGEHVDGHDFAKDACQRGAIAVLAEKPLPQLSVPVFVVDDCLKALTKIAVLNRQSLDLKVLALTGSNGKTTVKEMLGSILPSSAFISHGNFNNQLGVPINLMALNARHEYAVFELGANMIGDVAHTANLVKPDIALINNIGPAHLGKFGSIDNVARAKGEIYEQLASGGMAIVNDDDTYAHYWDKQLKQHEVLRFSSQHPADVWASDIREVNHSSYTFDLHFGQHCIHITLSVPGRHQVQNALAAASMALAAGISLEQIKLGLEAFTGVKGRLNFKAGLQCSTIIDDTYNANLASVKAGLQVLASQSGTKIFVMGDIAELEHYAKEQHLAMGQIAKDLGIDYLLAIGPFSFYAVEAFGDKGHHFKNQKDLIDYLKKCLNNQVTVLVKGSRSSRMENIVQDVVVN